MHDQSTPVNPKVRNVCWNKATRKWRVEFRVAGKKVFVGGFDDFEEARAIADALRPQYFPYLEERQKRQAAEAARLAALRDIRQRNAEKPWWTRPENREKLNKSQRNLYQRRREWYITFMRGRSCLDCGRTDARLEWHHRDPTTKKFSIGQYRVHPQSEILAEIEKCDLLCRPCHLKRHNGRWKS